jgi:chitosanase
MSYDQQTWVDGPNGGTPLSAGRLNHQEAGIKEASLRLDAVEGRVSSLEGLGGGTGGAGNTGTNDAMISDFTMTADTTIPVPVGAVTDGELYEVLALASGAARTCTFASGFLLSTRVTTLTYSVPQNQVLLASAEYSALAGAWVLTDVTITSNAAGGGSTSSGALFAGADATAAPGSTFTRTATEPTGVTITSRAWTIVSGPLGEGTTIGTAAALSWPIGSSPSGTTDLRQPVIQEMCFEIVQTAENSTKDWTTTYNYIQDIGDQRGYTGGLIGFTSATGDMLQLVQRYVQLKPTSNPLSSYLTGLQNCANVGYGSGASSAAASNLGTAFQTAWASAANTDPLFRQAQRELRKSIYWDDALKNALQDGVSPLGLALHYDVLVNHGPGTDSESYGGIIAAARASTSKPPSAGGTESAYLTKICDLRDAVLQSWGDYQSDGRSTIYRSLISAGKFSLLTPFSWSVYGDSYTMSTRPSPPSDSQIGTFVLRYTATGAGSDDLTLTVQ